LQSLVKEGLQIYQSMKSGLYGDLQPDEQHQICIVDALGWAGWLEEAELFLKTNITKPDHVAWSSLLGACHKHGNVAQAERVAESIHLLEPLDATSQVLLGNIYAAAGQWEDKAHLWEKMAADNVKKVPGRSWIMVNGKQHIFTAKNRAHPRASAIHAELERLWGQMKAAGYIPDTSVVSHLFKDDDEAKDCHIRQHSEKIALAFGLLSTPPATTLHVFKNLRVCPDCHQATKFISQLTQREIIIPDVNHFHHIHPDGQCSCEDSQVPGKAVWILK